MTKFTDQEIEDLFLKLFDLRAIPLEAVEEHLVPEYLAPVPGAPEGILAFLRTVFMLGYKNGRDVAYWQMMPLSFSVPLATGAMTFDQVKKAVRSMTGKIPLAASDIDLWDLVDPESPDIPQAFLDAFGED